MFEDTTVFQDYTSIEKFSIRIIGYNDKIKRTNRNICNEHMKWQIEASNYDLKSDYDWYCLSMS